MRNLRRNFFALFFALLACVTNTPRVDALVSNASAPDITAISGQGTFNNVDVFRIDSSGSVLLSSYTATSGTCPAHTTISNQGVHTYTGNVILSTSSFYPAAYPKLFFGASTVGISTVAAAGTSQSSIYTVFLASGPSVGSGQSLAATEGCVVLGTATQNGLVTVIISSANAGSTQAVGVAVSAASTGTLVNVYTSGFVTVLSTGIVVPGDTLVVSALQPGALQTAIGASSSTVAVALSSSSATGGGLIRAKLK